jgi:hypothetical protein
MHNQPINEPAADADFFDWMSGDGPRFFLAPELGNAASLPWRGPQPSLSAAAIRATDSSKLPRSVS